MPRSAAVWGLISNEQWVGRPVSQEAALLYSTGWNPVLKDEPLRVSLPSLEDDGSCAVPQQVAAGWQYTLVLQSDGRVRTCNTCDLHRCCIADVQTTNARCAGEPGRIGEFLVFTCSADSIMCTVLYCTELAWQVTTTPACQAHFGICTITPTCMSGGSDAACFLCLVTCSPNSPALEPPVRWELLQLPAPPQLLHPAVRRPEP